MMFDFSIVTTAIDSLLRQTLGLGDFWSILIECVLVGVGILTIKEIIILERLVQTSDEQVLIIVLEGIGDLCPKCLEHC